MSTISTKEQEFAKPKVEKSTAAKATQPKETKTKAATTGETGQNLKPKPKPKSKSKKQGSTQAKSAKSQAPAKTEGKNQMLGKKGEDMACYYLENNDIAILERNWKCKAGEADIIAEERETLVFIEVKTRSTGYSGLPEYAVTKQKRAKYEKIATSYLSSHMRPSGRVRFDVIAIQMTGEMQCMLRHHRDAFAAGE